MIDYFVLVAVCMFLGMMIQSQTARFPNTGIGMKYRPDTKVFYFLIIVLLICFAGLRTRYNDTSTYMAGFRNVDARRINWEDVVKPYGGFAVYQQLIKKYISPDPQAFIAVSAVFTTVLFVPFISKHTNYFTESLFLFMTGFFMFTMASIKQAIAMTIAVYALDQFLKKQYGKSVLIIWIAMTFHPYVVCLLCVPFLANRIWDKKTLLICCGIVLALANLERLFGFLAIIGKDYSNESFDNYTINPIRVFIELIPVYISFIYRNQLRKANNKILNLGVNMQIISAAFITFGLFMNPIYLGRMATFFSVLSCIMLPEMLRVCFGRKGNGPALRYGYYLLFFAYFLADITKIGSISLTYDRFAHLKISEFLEILFPSGDMYLY